MDSHWHQSLGNHFWNDESNGRTAVNPNGKVLVDFMRDLDPAGTRTKQRRQRKRPKPKCILLASYYAPSRAHAGGLRILDLYEEIRARDPSIRLALFSCSHPKVDGDISSLGNLFDDLYFCEPHEFGPETLRRLRNDSRKYDLVDLQFHQAGLEAPGFRQFGKSLIYTPMEVLSRVDFHLVRQAAAKGQLPLDKFFSLIHRGAEEHRIMQSVDSTVCVSDADADFLLNFSGSAEVTYFPTGLSKIEFAQQLRPNYKPAPIRARKNRLVFAAYFGSETNAAGLEWYLREVHPQVLAACPNYNLAVVGRGDTGKLEALGAPSVSFIGEAPSLSPVLEQCKGGLVLALHGGGFRGKINQYALCGLPTVSTSLGVTGLSYRDGKDILIGDGPAAFAEKCITILTREKDAQRLARAARKRALDCYSWSAIWPQIARIYGLA
jgi:glycosyltransferase involved in cell wall biosynthesis